MSLPAPLAARLGSAGIPPGLQNAAWDACAAFFFSARKGVRGISKTRPGRAAVNLFFIGDALHFPRAARWPNSGQGIPDAVSE